VSSAGPISLADVHPGEKLEGTVKKVTLSGAIVDVGVVVDGLLHISDLGDKRVMRTSDVLSEGQSIAVWVKKVDAANNRLNLTMVEPPRFRWEDLKPGLKTEGRVVRLEKFGAFVDIGVETDGLVHISEMATGRINNPSDIVSVGQVIPVWVKEADRKARRISLSMVEPPEVDLRTLKPDTILTGRVVRLENFGAFVDIGAGRDGLIHVTEMGRGYVGNPSEIVSVGDEVQVRVVEIDPRKGRISLSMKDLPTEEIAVEEGEEAPSSIELAFRMAMDGEEMLPIKPDRRRQREPRRQRDRMQEEIMERTLRERR
jgi:small subunit ribosomal protein S1